MPYQRTYRPAGWKDATHGHLRKPVEREKSCRQCGGSFKVVSRGRILGRKYCSQKCQREALQQRAKWPKERPCKQCGTRFRPAYPRQPARFCSPRCRGLFLEAQRWVDIQCAQCDRTVQRLRAAVARNDRSFCSVECRTQFHRGEHHPQFRGTPAPFGYDWKRRAMAARTIDGHACRRCGRVWAEGERLYPVDHIYPRRHFLDPSLADHLLNLATLCHSCHGEKTAGAEAAWLRGDVLAFEAYKAAVLTLDQRRALSALVSLSAK